MLSMAGAAEKAVRNQRALITGGSSRAKMEIVISDLFSLLNNAGSWHDLSGHYDHKLTIHALGAW